MRKILFACALVIAGCTWSNSLYQARRLSDSAKKAEREGRGFNAGSYWGQVAVKAESAFVREPDGDSAGEALWLRGRALAHLGDCGGALPLLEQARVMTGNAQWVDELMVELARCRSLQGDHAAAIATLEPLAESEDEDVRELAQIALGRALARAGDWDEAVATLVNDPTEDGRWQYALALAHNGAGDSAISVVGPRLAMNDSMADWTSLLRALAAADLQAADRLIELVMEMPRQGDTTRAELTLATAEGLPRTDTLGRRLRLEAVLELKRTPSTAPAILNLVDLMIEQVTTLEELEAVLSELERMAIEDPAVAFSNRSFTSWATALVAENDSIADGAPEGDLAMWFQASIARDTLGAIKIADHFLARMERGWPSSPYLPKAMLVRLATTSPDSAAAIRARLNDHAGSEYLAFLRGEETAEFARLEDSLDFYIGNRFAEKYLTDNRDDDDDQVERPIEIGDE